MPPRAGIVFRTIVPIVINYTAFVVLPFGFPVALNGGLDGFNQNDLDFFKSAIQFATLSALGAWTFLNAVAEMSYLFYPTRRNVIFANLAWIVVVGMSFFVWVAMVTNC